MFWMLAVFLILHTRLPDAETSAQNPTRAEPFLAFCFGLIVVKHLWPSEKFIIGKAAWGILLGGSYLLSEILVLWCQLTISRLVILNLDSYKLLAL